MSNPEKDVDHKNQPTWFQVIVVGAMVAIKIGREGRYQSRLEDRSTSSAYVLFSRTCALLHDGTGPELTRLCAAALQFGRFNRQGICLFFLQGNRRATWVPRIQPSVFTDLARDRAPLREVPQGLLGSGLPLLPRLDRSRDLPPAFDRLEEESPGPFTGRTFRISEENSLSDFGEDSPGGASLGRRSSGSRADNGRVSIESAAAEPTVRAQIEHLILKHGLRAANQGGRLLFARTRPTQ